MAVRGLFTKIYHDILNDQSSLPNLPDIVINLRKALAEKDLNIDTLTRVVQTDVGACTYLLEIANSPAYRTRVKANDIQSIIRIIGFSKFQNLINVYAARSLVDVKHPVTRKYLSAHWKQSAYRAAIANVVARQSGKVDADTAILAGLLQDVGVLPILTKLQIEHLVTMKDNEVDEATNMYSAKVGVVLAQKWALGEELQAVIRNGGNLSYDGGQTIDIVDIVNIAGLLAQIGQPQFKWPNIECAPCLSKFGENGLSAEASILLLKEAREDINEIKRVLFN